MPSSADALNGAGLNAAAAAALASHFPMHGGPGGGGLPLPIVPLAHPAAMSSGIPGMASPAAVLAAAAAAQQQQQQQQQMINNNHNKDADSD